MGDQFRIVCQREEKKTKTKKHNSDFKFYYRQDLGEEGKNILWSCERFPLGRPKADFHYNVLQTFQYVTRGALWNIWNDVFP